MQLQLYFPQADSHSTPTQGERNGCLSLPHCQTQGEDENNDVCKLLGYMVMSVRNNGDGKTDPRRDAIVKKIHAAIIFQVHCHNDVNAAKT